jgi:phosphate transport system ATP-binding protein
LSFKIESKNLNLWYGEKQALKNINLGVLENKITALIGPSGCGKSTYIRCLNRMNDLIDKVRVDGEVLYEGTNIYGKDVDVVEIRKRIGMVFQKPNPFPMSIYDNTAYGPRIHGAKA